MWNMSIKIKFKIQNKFSTQISNAKIKVSPFVIYALYLFWMSNFGICNPVYAWEPPRYEIDAFVDTANHKITAKQKVSFTNNYEGQLNEIYFHIYPHRKYTEQEKEFILRYAGYFKIDPYPEGFQSGDLKIIAVKSNDKVLSYSVEGKDKTLLKVNLSNLLSPGQTVDLEIDFMVDIPHSYGRFGWHNDIITLIRWYPILSVYDEEGWHNYPFYIYHQPYFSQASFYKVKLTLPKREVVAHTGILKEEISNPKGTKTLILETGFPVRDFSLGISPDFKLFSLESDNIKINSFYLNGNAERSKQAAICARDLIHFYSRHFGSYPYKEFNIVPSFLGHGGHESSNLIFIDTRVYKLPHFLNRYFYFLISHETGHQWFYNIIGSNEYKETFLDEGLNSYWTIRYLEDKYGEDAYVMELPKVFKWFIPNFTFRDSMLARYIYMAKRGLDRPIIGELSSFQEPSSIFALTYGKGAGVIWALNSLLGEDKFLKVMQRYTQDFRFKNAKLKDLIRLCQEETAQDLSDFFRDWLYTDKSCDYAVKSVECDKVVLENRGKIQMPIETEIIFADGSQSFDSWDGKGGYRVISLPENRQVKKVNIDTKGALILDIDQTNNHWSRDLNIKPVPLYFFAYEIPVFLPRDAMCLVFGPDFSSEGVGLKSSLQKPDDNIFYVSSSYDFNGEQVKTRLGYEFRHLFNKMLSLGFEIFSYESSNDKENLKGGKIFLRQELWPASYGITEINDHITIYLIRDREFEKSYLLSGLEDIEHLNYLKKDEAILGITAFLGRYGPYSDPDYGYKIIPTLESAGHFLGGKTSFWRTSVELDNYKSISASWAHKLASRIKFGWGESSDKVLFRLGGDEGLRGYGRKTIRGSRMLLGSLEYRARLISDCTLYLLDNIIHLENIQVVPFFDIGKAWRADFNDADFKKDAGLGFRFYVNLAGFLEKIVLRLDFAQAINEPKEKPHIWFSISHTF